MLPDLAPLNLLFFSMSFCGKWAWHPPGHATPFSFWLQIAEIMSFLLMYCLFLNYHRFFQNIEKGLRFFFKMILFSQSPQSNIISNKYFLYLFSIFWKNRWQCRNKQYISRKLMISAIWSQKEKGVAWSGGCHAHVPQKDIEKKSKFDGANSGCKNFFFQFNFWYAYVMS